MSHLNLHVKGFDRWNLYACFHWFKVEENMLRINQQKHNCGFDFRWGVPWRNETSDNHSWLVKLAFWKLRMSYLTTLQFKFRESTSMICHKIPSNGSSFMLSETSISEPKDNTHLPVKQAEFAAITWAVSYNRRYTPCIVLLCLHSLMELEKK